MIASLSMAYIAIGLFCLTLVVIAIIDLRQRRIHNLSIAVLVAIWLVWVTTGIATGISERTANRALGDLGVVDLGVSGVLQMVGIPFEPTGVSVIDGVSAALLFGVGSLLLTVIFERLTGRFAMGGGDVKLLFAIGLFLGVTGEMIAILIACFVFVMFAIVFSVVARARFSFVKGSDEAIFESPDSSDSFDVSNLSDVSDSMLQTTMPFGPSIVIGCLISLGFLVLL